MNSWAIRAEERWRSTPEYAAVMSRFNQFVSGELGGGYRRVKPPKSKLSVAKKEQKSE